MELVTWSLEYGIPQHLLCSPAAAPQDHYTGSCQTLSDEAFGKGSTQERAKEKQIGYIIKGDWFYLGFLKGFVCVCLFSKSLFWLFLLTNEKEPGRKQSYRSNWSDSGWLKRCFSETGEI